MHGGDWVAEVLHARGVRFLFTLCGGHISPILIGAKNRGIRVVDVRAEATAVFAADAVARLSGTPGVAAVTAGPGVTNSVTAVKNAQLAQSPVVILGGAAPTALKGRGALQDIDQLALFKPHVKLNRAVRRLADLVPTLEEAFDTSKRGIPGPVFVEIPVDLLYGESVVRDWYLGEARKARTLPDRLLRLYLDRHLNRLFAGSADIAVAEPKSVQPPTPSMGKVRSAAKRLQRAERPLLLIGSQAMSIPNETQELANAVKELGIPCYLSGVARGLLGREHPLQCRHKRRQALRESDVVILAGVPCDFRLNYGRHLPSNACVIAANRSRHDIRLNRRPDIAALGDASLFLRELAKLRESSGDRWMSWRRELRARDELREQEIKQQAEADSKLCNPVHLCRRLNETMDEDAVIVADGGDFVATASYIVHPRGPLAWLDPGVFGTLGVGAGFALGAKLCRPESEVWLLYGDGAFGYSAIEFDTFVRHGISIVAVIGNDARWSQIAREQIKILDDDIGTRLDFTDYHRVVEGFGAQGFLLSDPRQINQVIRQAKQAAHDGKPVLINALLTTTDFREGSLSI